MVKTTDPNRLQAFHARSMPSHYRSMPIEGLLQSYASDGASIALQGEKRALDLFHLAAELVPAYKDFLQKNSVEPSKVRDSKDFQLVPPINKKNYLRAYPLEDMCWDGQLSPNYIFSSSSGSTGQPFLWPRGLEQELEGALSFESIFSQVFELSKNKTLYMDCFAMGTWIAGPFVLASAEILSQKGFDLLTVTPGIDKEVTYALFHQLAPMFDQIVISGYPPFIKDLLDGGDDHDIDWKKYRIKFLFAAEGFSEEWRAHVHRLVGATDDLTTSINLYGSADAAILAHETPLSISIRRFIHNHNKGAEFFNSNLMPTLTQYDPRLKYFEQQDNQLLFTTDAGLPLVRYSIGDEGGVISYNQMLETMQQSGYQINQERDSMGAHLWWQLPFAYVFGRSDFTVSLYGLLIYPEHIKFGLEQPELMKKISGKFVLSIEHSEEFDPYLSVKVELADGVEGSQTLSDQVQKAIFQGLLNINSEYFRLEKEMGVSIEPTVELINQGDQRYFKQGVKQRWVQK